MMNLREVDPRVIDVDQLRGHQFQPVTLDGVPKLYETESTPAEHTVIHLHYFVGGCDWWVAEVDPDSFMAFGYACLAPGCGEWGYIDLKELAVTVARKDGGITEVGPADGEGERRVVRRHAVQLVVERDCFWQPRPWGEVAP